MTPSRALFCPRYRDRPNFASPVGQQSQGALAQGGSRRRDIIDHNHGGVPQRRIGADRESVPNIASPFSGGKIRLRLGVPGSDEALRHGDGTGPRQSHGQKLSLVESPVANPIGVERNADEDIRGLKNLSAPRVGENSNRQPLGRPMPSLVLEGNHAIAERAIVNPQGGAPRDH